ncbi:MAG: hypothetical protein MI919_01250 [Holophagales bacterium]|nr:hypothetical protein [Holophagales bacterium]
MKKTTLCVSFLFLILTPCAFAADEHPTLDSDVDASAEAVVASQPLPSAAEEAALASVPAVDCDTDSLFPPTVLDASTTGSASGPAVCGACSFGGCANLPLGSRCFVFGGVGECLPVFPDNLQCPDGDGFWCTCVGGF